MSKPWPAPADAPAAQRLIDRFVALGPAEAAFVHDNQSVLAALGGNSPFLTDLALREPATLISAVAGADACIAEILATVRAIPFDAPRPVIMAGLRCAKRQAALTVAVADLSGQWALHRITGALSGLAEATLRLALQHALATAHASQDLILAHPDEPERHSGVVLLGMGKLGAGELNYSSDIDLIVLYDPDCHPERPGRPGPSATFTRLARILVALMETRDADGYVFRTDLRLRPDPASTPPAITIQTAIAYYESMGQNWERAAMTKARPVAGDLALGQNFLEAIRPFVWRRGLDFAAIADIGAMKQRIDAHRGATETLANLNVKLAPGGIREIEFIAQTLQLVWGGRTPGLRDRGTVGALRRLVAAGRLQRRGAAELIVAYRVLRTIEHRLQMVADRQTHSLPAGEALGHFAIFMGCADQAGLAALLAVHRDRVRHWYAQVFASIPATSTLSLDLTGTDLPQATADMLHSMGFREHASMVATLRGWQTGRLRALRTGRARELMDAVLPQLLPALGRQPDPDAAFARFDLLLARLPAGVGLLSMLLRNPTLVSRVANVLGAAPALADYLAQVPSALEGLLDPGLGVPDAGSAMRHQLQDARTLEDRVTLIRRLVRAEDFRLSVAQMEGAMQVDEAGTRRTALADATLDALLPAILSDLTARYGRVRGGAMAVVALGKAGGQEMMAGSDLDLMLVYWHPEAVTVSDGTRAMAASQWFIRAAHAYVAALTARGADGPLYDVDMRLRPSGNKGPVAVSLPAFVQYHSESAWTWERMALTRARVVAGSPAMRARVGAAIAGAMARPNPATLTDAASMRGRLLRELPPTGPWDMKMRPGGGIEVEFVAQALQLVHGVVPGGQCTRVALAGLAARGLLPEAGDLIAADHLWRTIQSMVRITAGRGATALPPAAEATLLHVAGLDSTSFPATVAHRAAQVRAAFLHHIGPIP